MSALQSLRNPQWGAREVPTILDFRFSGSRLLVKQTCRAPNVSRGVLRSTPATGEREVELGSSIPNREGIPAPFERNPPKRSTREPAKSQIRKTSE
jgi:hypothetical protein